MPANLVHEDQCPFKGIVDLLIDTICNALAFHLLPPQAKVIVPQLVTADIKTSSIKRKPKSNPNNCPCDKFDCHINLNDYNR